MSGRIIKVIAPVRSGHHAIIWWIRHHTSICTYLINDVCRSNNIKELYEAWKKFKDTPTSLIFNIESDEYKHAIEYLPPYGLSTKYTLLVLRDPFNNLASQIKWQEQWGYVDCSLLHDLWKSYAQKFIASENIIPVNFNKWFLLKSYRLSVAHQIELVTDGCPFLVVPNISNGSSFDLIKYNHNATNMDVLTRWIHYKDHPLMLKMFNDPELMELSYKIFGDII